MARDEMMSMMQDRLEELEWILYWRQCDHFCGVSECRWLGEVLDMLHAFKQFVQSGVPEVV